MSWLRNTSLSIARQLSRSLDPRHDYEPQACYSSFCKHWQQAHDIILKSQPHHLHDDVLGVVNHLEQLVTLLVLEARAREVFAENNPAACLEHLLCENLLDKLFEWGICTGMYENAVRLEELKIFGSLITHYNSHVIAAEPFLRPLLKLLSGFRNELPPSNLENQLVTVLNQLCVALMQNMKLIDLFFLTTHTQNGSQAEFIIVRLLLASVHREGSTGSCARDALLLCAKMSARNTQLADYMLVSNTCPVLATGLSGLYSLLPRTLGENVHRLTPDDVNAVHKLTLFIDSLEFCNAVAQVAHSSIRKHLLDLLYQGFLIPVMGPAILQNGVADQAAAVAYLELVIRCVTVRGLLRAVLHYLFTQEYDGVKVIDVLLARLEGSSQLSLVCLSLMETLVDLNCEDVMLELIFKYLLSGQYLAAPHRHRVADPEPYRDAAVAFLSLRPVCCSRPIEVTKKWVDELELSGRKLLGFKREDENIVVNGVQEDIQMEDLVRDFKFNYGNPNETLYGNYHAYLCDARFEIVSRMIACRIWSSTYDSVNVPNREANNNTAKEIKESDPQAVAKEQDSLISICTSGYDTLKNSDTSEKESHSLTSLIETVTETDNTKVRRNSDGKDHDSLTSIGESSGYDSFKYRADDGEDDLYVEDMFFKNVLNVANCVPDYASDPPFKNWKVRAESIIGPLMNSLLKKIALFLESEVSVNCRVTSIISKLISLPTPLLNSLLLSPGFVLQPNVPSMYQILLMLKEEVDELTRDLDNCGELVDKARVYLIQREITLVKSRAQQQNDGHAQILEPQSHKSEDMSFKRGEPKRRSISSSLSNMFARRLSSSPSQHTQHSYPQSTYNSSPQRRYVFTQDEYWNQSITLRTILNAVLFDEWLKELGALCEEHALRLSARHYEDETYIRPVAL